MHNAAQIKHGTIKTLKNSELKTTRPNAKNIHNWNAWQKTACHSMDQNFDPIFHSLWTKVQLLMSEFQSIHRSLHCQS